MANWNDPTVNSNYVDFVAEVKDRDVDAALMFDGAGTNLPNLTIRWSQSNNRFERLEGASWEPRVIALSGGGTGGSTASAARTNLGLGSAAVQADNRYAHRSNNLSDLANAATARGNLDLGTAAVQNDDRYVHRTGTDVFVTNQDGGLIVRTNDNDGDFILQARSSGNAPRLTVAHGATEMKGDSSGWEIGGHAILLANSNLNADNLTAGTVHANRLPFETETITLGGDFGGSNHVHLTKIGTIVVCRFNAISHTTGSTANSATSPAPIPAAFRPVATQQYTGYLDPFDTAAIQRIQIESDGWVSVNHRDSSFNNADKSQLTNTTVVWTTA